MIEREILRKLYYEKKFSMWDTAKAMAVTPATVAYWMKKYDFQRRSIGESAYVKQNPNGDPFEIKKCLTQKENELLLIGLMLYWAEGSRKNRHVIQLANLDVRMIKIFIEFLKIICGVKENKICLTIQLYKNFSREATKKYWNRELGILRQFIAVNIHSDIRSKPCDQWAKYGIARIEVRNVKLKKWIDDVLAEYLRKWI